MLAFWSLAKTGFAGAPSASHHLVGVRGGETMGQQLCVVKLRRKKPEFHNVTIRHKNARARKTRIRACLVYATCMNLVIGMLANEYCSAVAPSPKFSATSGMSWTYCASPWLLFAYLRNKLLSLRMKWDMSFSGDALLL